MTTSPTRHRRAATPADAGEPKELLTVPDVAAYFGVPPSWVYDKVKIIKHYRLCGHLRFRQADLDAYVNANAVSPLTD